MKRTVVHAYVKGIIVQQFERNGVRISSVSSSNTQDVQGLFQMTRAVKVVIATTYPVIICENVFPHV